LVKSRKKVGKKSITNFHFLSYYRKVKGGMLEAHPREKSIIVNYKLEAAVYGDNDVVDPMLADRKVRKEKK
jgi:hypothetical protein